MKKLFSAIFMLCLSVFAFAQEEQEQLLSITDSIENSFKYEYGTIELSNGIGKVTLPKGFKYLNKEQATRVLVDLWGNPGGTDITLGLILPETQGILSDSGYVYNIQYDEIGYVEDDDADDINYDELLEQMQTETQEANKTRQAEGYEPITIVGWAAKPFYDKDKKILHWAKEIQFGSKADIPHTLNYNVRILGRKGVLVLNAISAMPNLAAVQKDIPKVLDIVQFSDGNKYSDFDSSVDEVAAWSLGGLVAGKVLAKVGFFAFLLKFWKFIAFGAVALISTLWKKLTGKKEEETAPQKEGANTAQEQA